MSENTPPEGTPAWLQLYLTRNMPKPTQSAIPNPVGRPSREVPVKRTTTYLTAKDKKILLNWQKYFGTLLGKSQVSNGEALSLLIRICEDRLKVLGGPEQFHELTDLTRAMIGEEENSPE